MGRYVTPRGVEVEVGDEAARVVGYKPVAAESKDEQPKKKAPAKKAASSSNDKK